MKAAVVTVSDGVSEGTREDASGDLLAELLAGEGYEVERRVVPDERDAIADAIVELAEEAVVVLTTGGTGVASRDVTPEATRDVLERDAPGIAEAIRADSIAKTPHALLSRGLAGVRGRALVVNLPGSPGGCRDGFAVLRPALAHAVSLLAGEGYEVERRVVPDERDAIADAIVELAEEAVLVLTTGGTGVAPRDVTPEATRDVLERDAPGIAEAIRADSIAKTPHALLSRGLAGVRGRALVVNLPGSPGGCRDGFAVLSPALAHAVSLLAGEPTAHRQT